MTYCGAGVKGGSVPLFLWREVTCKRCAAFLEWYGKSILKDAARVRHGWDRVEIVVSDASARAEGGDER
mgnify:CR=1 FL=1